MHAIIKEAFLPKEWNSFHLSWKKLDYLHLQDVLTYECELFLKQPLTPPQCKTIFAYYTSNHRLAIQVGRWMTIPISRDTTLRHFCSYNVLENEAHFMLECPSLEISFHHFWECNSWELKSIFQLHHQSWPLASISCRLPVSATLEN